MVVQALWLDERLLDGGYTSQAKGPLEQVEKMNH
jgi:hypothetical protein